MFMLSFVSFIIIELPPGDFAEMTVRALEVSGSQVDEGLIEQLNRRYGYDKPYMTRYTNWITDILFQQDFGISMAWNKPVMELIGDRIPFTILLSAATLVFTYAMAVPIGIFSATRQYSIGDYFFSFLGFIGVAVPDFLLALVALDHRGDWGHFGWRQDDLFMAYLGLTDQARDGLVERARDAQSDRFPPHTGTRNESRFPIFWGPNYGWIPDQDHGGVFLRTLQSMLIQSEGKRIYLFPAWPSNWDVDFKLHAPFQTIIEGRLQAGELVYLTITPESRRSDVTVMLG